MFKNFKKLEEVEFEEGCQIEEIGIGSFFGCENLKSLSFPITLKKIGIYAFRQCGLKEAELPPFAEIENESFDSECEISVNKCAFSADENGEPIVPELNHKLVIVRVDKKGKSTNNKSVSEMINNF